MANVTPAKGQILVKWLPENDKPVSNGDGSVNVPTAQPSYVEKPLCQLEVLSGPKVGQIALASMYSMSDPLPGSTDVYFIDEASIKGYADAPISPASYTEEDSTDA